ncbi:hypothetical protein PMAC_001124 [Pneumocystis sp. 'macacae']|nr:hypothetical protein PMAC_001124 [Pneumocystis sp. 'macacae']
MKRITWYPQVVLGSVHFIQQPPDRTGFTFNWGILMGWPALVGWDKVVWAACLPLYLSGVLWTIVYDTVYAHQVRRVAAVRHGHTAVLGIRFTGHTVTVVSRADHVQDKLDDASSAVYSMALLLGKHTKPCLSVLSAAQVGALALAGYMNGQTALFYVLSCGTSVCYALWMLRAVDLDQPQSCWRWFLRSKYPGLLVAIGPLLDWTLRLSA